MILRTFSRDAVEETSLVATKLTDNDFNMLRQWLFHATGIYFNETKKHLVSGRLQKRIRELRLNGYFPYIKLLSQDADEAQVAINLLTTNETYFFREQKHFDYLAEVVLPSVERTQALRVWSAAASSGEEAYSVALLLHQHLGLQRKWSVIGTDINTQVLSRANGGIYSMDISNKIPFEMLKRSCVKGKGKDQGRFRIKAEVRERVQFIQGNLMQPMPFSTSFQVVFLRNVLIYFDLAEKQKIVENILRHLMPGGWLLVGHSESIAGYDPRLAQDKAGCYQFKP
ncbi:CheR family methyltransferase [Vibrio navarrensis]|uniref:CheR family methyltransferase n=1 Tax=Vibrio navarrensis TaxID=29495 RepID=UPI00338E4F4B